jgi:hypothetical protein
VGRRALVVLAGAALLTTIGIVLLTQGAGETTAAAPSRERAGRDDRSAPLRSELRPARRKHPPAAASVTPREPPADLAEAEAIVEDDPEGALAFIRGITPADDAEAEHAKALEIRALVSAGRIGKARGETARYYERWPNGPNAELLERLTGAHPAR